MNVSETVRLHIAKYSVGETPGVYIPSEHQILPITVKLH